MSRKKPATRVCSRHHNKVLPMNATENKWYKYMTWTMLWLMVLRLIAMWFIPLNETTEARYGEIARKMVETGDWITLYHDYGVPFWAKPPLSTWSSAFFMELFGVNGFWARFPSLLFAIGTVLLTGFLVKKREGELPPKIGSMSFRVESNTVTGASPARTDWPAGA